MASLLKANNQNNQQFNSPGNKSFHIDVTSSNDNTEMKQIKLNYNSPETFNRQNRVKSVNDYSPNTNTNQLSNKVKKVFIYTGSDTDSQKRMTASPKLSNENSQFQSKKEPQTPLPNYQGKQVANKGILKLNRQTPSSNQSSEHFQYGKDQYLSQSSVEQNSRQQMQYTQKNDSNLDTLQQKASQSIQLMPLYQGKANMNQREFNDINFQKNNFYQSYSTQTNFTKQNSISSNEGAHSDQTHNKQSSYRKNSSMLLAKNQNVYGDLQLNSQQNSKKFNHSVDFSTTSNGGLSDINTTITNQKTPFLSPETHLASPLLEKDRNSQFLNKENFSFSLNEQSPFKVTNQKFRISKNNSSFSEHVSQVEIEENDDYQENNIGSESNQSQKFNHCQNYIRKRIQSIENHKQKGSLPYINEDISEENGAPSFKESNFTQEEVNRKKRMVLERLKKGSTPNKFHYDEYYDNQKLEDMLHDPSSISIYHPSRNIYDHFNPLKAYQARSNIPLSNLRVVTDPNTYTHQLYHKANQKRQKDQERVVQLLEEQNRIMDRIISKYHKRAEQEENQLKQKLQELEKDRDQLVKLKNQESMLGLMHINLSSKVDQFKKNMSYYNSQMAPNKPQLRPNIENAFSDLQDLAFLDSILKQQQYKQFQKQLIRPRNKSVISYNQNKIV
ncbi:hypothetical protein ABPG74_001120 [Tetrahymena malaccensis]